MLKEHPFLLTAMSISGLHFDMYNVILVSIFFMD